MLLFFLSVISEVLLFDSCRVLCFYSVYLCVSLSLSPCICVFVSVDLCTGVKSVSIDVGKEEVLVESALTTAEVQALIESTGRRAVLKGIGGTEQGEEPQDWSSVYAE